MNLNTRVMLDHEPVADGGFFARAVLLIEGPLAGGVAPGTGAARHPSARNVQVAVQPGRDAEFIQMRHTHESRGSGDLLTILVGDVYALDRICIRMDALIGPGWDSTGEADVGRLVVAAHLRTEVGLELQTVDLPIRVSRTSGGCVRADVSRRPLTHDSPAGVPKAYTFGTLRVDGDTGRCA